MNASDMNNAYPSGSSHIPHFPVSQQTFDADSEIANANIEASAILAPPLSPDIISMLEDICSRGSYVIEPLSIHVYALQELFLNTLYHKLDEAGIDTNSKITLYLTKKGNLAVQGEHPQKKDIDLMLSANPALASVFIELSTNSELARDIININRVFSFINDQDAAYDERPSGYHLSLKGGMSHFFFV